MIVELPRREVDNPEYFGRYVDSRRALDRLVSSFASLGLINFAERPGPTYCSQIGHREYLLAKFATEKARPPATPAGRTLEEGGSGGWVRRLWVGPAGGRLSSAVLREVVQR